ncbi:PA14 domain-containing protein [Streptomyces sp. NPDC006458]|uniref:PA14 domain-containing protein n=1 Tax=Streptomyces sp. NPDC006458 TaxID=3154302 RepID=UPI0033B2875A
MQRKRFSATQVGGSVMAATLVLGGHLAAAPQAAAADDNCPQNSFKRTFYNNATFSGTPVRTDCDDVIDQTWPGSPTAGVPSDDFTVRWELTRDFGSGGPFTFAVSATDGVRVYLNGALKIDLWKGTGDTARPRVVNLTVSQSVSTIRVDYRNWTGAAKVKFGYAPRTSPKIDKTRPRTPDASWVYDPKTRKTTASGMANYEMDLAGYALYRRPVGVYTWTKVGSSSVNRVTQTTPNPDDRTPFVYEVRAVDRAGNMSGGMDKRIFPVPEVGLVRGSYDQTTGKVKLRWGKSYASHLDHYTVMAYEKVDGGHAWVPLGTTTEEVWLTDPVPADGQVHHYRVLATNTAGTTTLSPAGLDPEADNEVALALPDGYVPVQPISLTLDHCQNGVQVTVTDGMPIVLHEFIYFDVERRELGTDTWSWDMSINPRWDSDITTATMCERLPSDGRTYEYRARASFGDNEHSPYSEVKSITMPRA